MTPDPDKEKLVIKVLDKVTGRSIVGDASQHVVKILLDERGNRRMLEDPEAAKAMATTIIGVSVTLRKNHTLGQTILYGLQIAFIHRHSRSRFDLA